MAAYGYGGGPSMEYERPDSPTNVTQNRNNAMIDQANAVRVSQGLPPVNRNAPDVQSAAFQFRVNQIVGQQNAAARPRTPAPTPRRTTTGGGGGGGGGFRFSGGGGGGGGGGAAAPPRMNQTQLDWIMSILNGGRPDALTANTLDLPDYQGLNIAPFDPAMYNMARTALAQGQQTDLGTARQATQNMLNFLNTNYTNAFNNPNQTYATAGQAPGATQDAMLRLLQGQGVDPRVAAGTYQQAQSADQAFGNLWRTLAANEDIAQRSRVNNANLYGSQAVDAINAAAAAGNLGINLGQAGAQAAWQQRDEQRRNENYQMQQQIAQQEAMSNWQRGNEVQDTNFNTTNSYNNAEIQALIGLLPQLIGTNLNLPTAASLGLA